MKIHLRSSCAALFCLASLSVVAQSGPKTAAAGAGNDGPTIGSPSDKLFGTNVSYSASMETQTANERPLRTQVFVDQGKIRHELDLGQNLPAAIASQMGKQIILWLPDKDGFYQIHPALKGYLEVAYVKGKKLTASDYRIETTELGKETFEKHACIKSKCVVIDPQDRKLEFVVWNATDLNNFPIKIKSTDSLGESHVTIYGNVTLARPDPKLFELPAGYRKYSNPGEMVQDLMSRQFAGGFGL